VIVTVDDASPMPAFEQIRAQLASAIQLGTLPTGERLPTVRQLASDLRLAPGTVARAYAALESEGLVETRRGAGTRVSSVGPGYPEILGAAVELASAARRRSLSVEEAVLALRAAWVVAETK
jgi:GntR family transcriptional regulator